jgi:hypothetical protein
MEETVEQRANRLYRESYKRLDGLRGATVTSALPDEVHEAETRLKVLEEVLAIEDEPTD